MRDNIIKELSQYFRISELVCNHTFAKWGEMSWLFLDTLYLECLLIIRRNIIGLPMLCNFSTAHQRGLRCNMCPMVKQKKDVYLSSHLFGKAGDFTVQGMSAQEARNRIIAAAELLPCNIRLEGEVSWLHIDVLPQCGIKEKVYVFKG